MANSLSPAFVKINYSSAYGAHVMTVPSVALNPDNATPGNWDFDLRGAALDVRAADAVNDFVNLLIPFFPTSVNFIDAQLYRQPTPSSFAEPVQGILLNKTGTASETGIIARKATQATWTYRATDNTIFKTVMLDCAIYTWEKRTSLTGDALSIALRNYTIADVTWIASRGGGRPNIWLQTSHTLNEKLRRAYNMT